MTVWLAITRRRRRIGIGGQESSSVERLARGLTGPVGAGVEVKEGDLDPIDQATCGVERVRAPSCIGA